MKNGSVNGSYDNEDRDLQLNERALALFHEIVDLADGLNVVVHEIGQAHVVDCGVEVSGTLMSGRMMAETSLAELGGVHVNLERLAGRPCPKITIETESPVVACLLSQYAGWKVADKNFFAMTSGPIRALVNEEPIFSEFRYSEASEVAVAVMETSSLPSAAIVKKIAAAANINPDGLAIITARTASIAGSVQIVARSVETCMHKLHAIGADVFCVRNAIGSAFLPPIPTDDLTAIGRTNDSILYGAEVCLWVDADDDNIRDFGPKLPSSSSQDYGRPFRDLFEQAGGDFYKLDPLLFSPALVFINNLRTGSTFMFGKTDYDLLARSFFGE